jgi:hypothetical protein
VKVIGILTLGAVPGLNLALRKAEVAALSRIGLPVLAPILASVTLPSEPTETTIVPLPVILDLLAS